MNSSELNRLINTLLQLANFAKKHNQTPLFNECVEALRGCVHLSAIGMLHMPAIPEGNNQ